MLMKLLKDIINNRIKKHNFLKVVDKTYTDRGFVVEAEDLNDFFIDNDNYIITPIQSIEDCNKFKIVNDKVYLEKMKQLASSLLIDCKNIEKTCLIFEIDVDNLEAMEY